MKFGYPYIGGGEFSEMEIKIYFFNVVYEKHFMSKNLPLHRFAASLQKNPSNSTRKSSKYNIFFKRFKMLFNDIK